MAVTEVNKTNFEEEVLLEGQTVLVDFWAPWCAPCRVMAPIVEAYAAEHEEIKVCKINTSEESELAARYKVMNIPTLVVFHDKEAVYRSVGVISKEEIEHLVK